MTWRDRIAWLLIICIIGYSVIATQMTNNDLEETQKQQQADRCQSSQEIRDATRANIRAVYALAVGAVAPPSTTTDPPLTPEEQAQVDRYLAVAKNFRDDALSKIPPVSPGCEDYVKQQEGGE